MASSTHRSKSRHAGGHFPAAASSGIAPLFWREGDLMAKKRGRKEVPSIRCDECGRTTTEEEAVILVDETYHPLFDMTVPEFALVCPTCSIRIRHEEMCNKLPHGCVCILGERATPEQVSETPEAESRRKGRRWRPAGAGVDFENGSEFQSETRSGSRSESKSRSRSGSRSDFHSESRSDS